MFCQRHDHSFINTAFYCLYWDILNFYAEVPYCSFRIRVAKTCWISSVRTSRRKLLGCCQNLDKRVVSYNQWSRNLKKCLPINHHYRWCQPCWRNSEQFRRRYWDWETTEAPPTDLILEYSAEVNQSEKSTKMKYCIMAVHLGLSPCVPTRVKCVRSLMT